MLAMSSPDLLPMMAFNPTVLRNGTSFSIPPSELITSYPFYYIPRPTVFPGISDQTATLAAPVIAYWIASLFFHLFDISGWKWLDKYRLHESQEVKTRNLATRGQVVRAVIFQQVIQTVLGFFWVTETEKATKGIDHAVGMQSVAAGCARVVSWVLGSEATERMMMSVGAGKVAWWVYWWGIPVAQFLFAAFVLDTWQYFLHRAMHVNKWLYKHLHSVHHRLYVPYAFGALYNHPVEGFLLDTLGAVISEACAGLSIRQAAFFFVFSTSKTVDDHCGYNLPWDPLQMLSGNTADYHDIHHQVIGIKSNFSQPFFVHWDVILGTRMTRQDIELRKDKSRSKKAA